jgi:hypothetical protein
VISRNWLKVRTTSSSKYTICKYFGTAVSTRDMDFEVPNLKLAD